MNEMMQAVASLLSLEKYPDQENWFYSIVAVYRKNWIKLTRIFLKRFHFRPVRIGQFPNPV